MSTLIGQALQLLQSKLYDELQAELAQIAESYRFCNRVRESAEANAKKLTDENVQLKLRVAQLETELVSLQQARSGNAQVVQKLLAESNVQAQARMQEIESLRTEMRRLHSLATAKTA